MTYIKQYTLLLLALFVLSSDTIAKKKKNNKKNTPVVTAVEKSRKVSLKEESSFIDAMQSKLLGNYNEALLKFSAIVKDDPLNDEAFFQLAQIYYQLGELDKAQTANEKAIDLNPNYEWHYLLLGQIKAENGNINEAADAYKKLVEISPNDLDLYFDWAMLLTEADRPEEAIDVYNLIEERTGLNEETLVQKLPLYQKTNQLKKAIEDIQSLIKEDSTQFRYFGYLGDMYEAQNKHDKSIEAYLKILEINPGNILSYYSLSEAYAKKKDTINQKKILSEAMNSEDIDIDDKVRIILPVIQQQLADKDSADNNELIFDLFQTLKNNYPDHPEVIGLISETYQALGEPEKAISYLKENVNSSDPDQDLYIQFLFMLSENENLDDLYYYSQKGEKKFPEEPVFDFFTALSAFLNKDYNAAKAAYEHGLKKDFSNEALRLQMLVGLGDVSGELKAYETADDAYEQALAINPNNATALNNYAYYLSVRNIELPRAERMSKKSNLLEENNAAFLDTYAWILYQKGEYEEALNWMTRAMESAKGQPSAEMFDHLGDILFKLNKKSEALEFWEKALELNQDNKEIADKINSNR